MRWIALIFFPRNISFLLLFSRSMCTCLKRYKLRQLLWQLFLSSLLPPSSSLPSSPSTYLCINLSVCYAGKLFRSVNHFLACSSVHCMLDLICVILMKLNLFHLETLVDLLHISVINYELEDLLCGTQSRIQMFNLCLASYLWLAVVLR